MSISLLSTLSIISIVLTFFLLEVYFKYELRESFFKTNWTRFNTFYLLFGIYCISVVLAIYFFNLRDLLPSFYVAIGLLVYIFITEWFFYEKTLKIRYKPQKAWLLGIIGVGSGVFTIAMIVGNTLTGGILPGALFTVSDWFTDTLFSIIQSDTVSATVSLMTIGALTIIIAKARRSGAIAVGGFFLIIGLPIFNLMDVLFTKMNDMAIVAPALYAVFLSEGLCLVIYIVIMIIFYLLLTSLILVFLAMMDSVII